MDFLEERWWPTPEEAEKKRLEDRVMFLENQMEFLMRERFGWWKWRTKDQNREFIIKELG